MGAQGSFHNPKWQRPARTDGSAWYDITENVCAYGGHKSTNGYGKRTFSNLNIFPQVC